MRRTSRWSLQFVFGTAAIAAMGFGATQALAKPQPADAPPTCPSNTVTCRCGLKIVACVQPGGMCPHCP